jgi:hypothetical protein
MDGNHRPNAASQLYLRTEMRFGIDRHNEVGKLHLWIAAIKLSAHVLQLRQYRSVPGRSGMSATCISIRARTFSLSRVMLLVRSDPGVSCRNSRSVMPWKSELVSG